MQVDQSSSDPSSSTRFSDSTKVISQREVFHKSREFAYTAVVLQNGEEYYTVKIQHRAGKAIETIDPISLNMLKNSARPLPLGEYCPPHQARFSLAPSPTPQDCYEKRPMISELRGEHILAEITTCEILKKYPHPSIVEYKGCLTEDGHITGLCFLKLHQTLVNRIHHDLRPFDRAKCISQIRSGIEHLHRLNLIHNDINPSNIMLDKDDNAVIIDFDASCKRGESGLKFGHTRFIDAAYNPRFATFENDNSGLRRVQEWLIEPEPFKYWCKKDRELHRIQQHHGQFTADDCFICYSTSERQEMERKAAYSRWPHSLRKLFDRG